MPRLIDADAAYALMEECGWYENGDRDIAEGVLDQLPTVDAEPIVHAHWEWALVGDSQYHKRLRCSRCHGEKNCSPEQPRCPWCGAKMDEVEDES